jgi:transcription elongation factor SPT6
MAPLNVGEMQLGDTPRVLAMSWGNGDPQRDNIHIVMVDEFGRLRDSTTLDNLTDDQHKDEFVDILDRRRPDVIVVGGFTMATTKLSARVKEIVNTSPGLPNIPVVFVPDDLARIYQHTEKQWDTLEAMAPLHKYCLGLARYAISPVNEFAAMSSDISELRFQDNDFDVNVV